MIFNREISWLQFNRRVLEEAQDLGNPLFERIRFISIVSSNLDEFFMVRVASLVDQVLANYTKKDSMGFTPKEQIQKIQDIVQEMVKDQYNTYQRSVLRGLKKEGIIFLKRENFTKEQEEYLERYFEKNIYPVLTPMVVDQSRPFPLILNKSLNIAVMVKDLKVEDDPYFGTIQVPSVLPRIVEIPNGEGLKNFVFMEDIIKLNAKSLFNGHEIMAMGCYRITRNADLSIDEDEAEDLLEEISQSIRQRKWGNVVRLEVEKKMDSKLLSMLLEEGDTPEAGIYEISGPLDLTSLSKFVGSLEDTGNLNFPKLKQIEVLRRDEDIFEVLRQRDILLHHPYESFQVVTDLVKKAAKDPDVLAIKQTLYRVSGNSPIIEALTEAAELGKQVTVLVELKARFDEENNINWAKKLEKAGCHVIYGLVGLKTHCKLLLIVRREEDGINRYVHLGTGNYNDVTARFYTDMGLMTTNPLIGSDASAIFNMLSGYSVLNKLNKLEVAPLGLREKFEVLIKEEIKNAQEGREAKIICKMNSLVDEQLINLFYKASQAGVRIELIVRGICCLVPGIEGLSENIEVRSVVGRFLEHSRIFYFYADGEHKIFMSSADMMPRNLDRRVEILFPVEEKEHRDRIIHILESYLEDTVKARILNSDGSYSRVDKRGKEHFNVQEYFYKVIKSREKERYKDFGIEIKPILSKDL